MGEPERTASVAIQNVFSNALLSNYRQHGKREGAQKNEIEEETKGRGNRRSWRRLKARENFQRESEKANWVGNVETERDARITSRRLGVGREREEKLQNRVYAGNECIMKLYECI